MLRFITLLSQWLLGATFIFSSLMKAVDPVGTKIKMSEYLLHFELPWLADWAMLLAWGLIFLECIVGLYVFFGRNLRIYANMALLVMLVFTPLTLYLALYNPVDDCGCFGDAVVLTNWQTFGKNVVLLACAIWLVVFRRRAFKMLSINLYTYYYYGMLICVLVFCAIGTWRLPFIDFRPYRPGIDLKAAVGSSSSQTEVGQYYCIYQRGDELCTFALDSIPDEADGWEFVRTIDPAEVVSDRSIASTPDADLPFFVLNAEGEEVTDHLLSHTGYTFLLLSPNLSEASEHDIDKIEQVYEYVLQEGYRFYCLTLNDPQAIGRWRFRTGAEYEFLFTDQTVVETMIRCNPGLMLLHNGVILWKSHLADIDVKALTSAKLSEQTYGQIGRIDRKTRLFWLILWAFGPLCLYLPMQIANFYIHKRKNKMRKKIVAGNWKMNTTLQEGVALAEGLKAALEGKKVNCDVVVCTPFISVASVVKAVEGSVIGVGAEDCSAHDKGAYTGEVAANMVASTGAKYVILGHSERRQYHGENNELLVAKLQQALANGLTPIFCVGEVKEERENGTFKAVIEGQMEAMYTLSADDFAKCVVAYEPVWAIGTGLTATSEQAQEVHAFIRASIAKKYNAEVADNTSILYGGSCKGSNAPELFSQPDIDGGLIGGAALKVDTFMPIIEAWK